MNLINAKSLKIIALAIVIGALLLPYLVGARSSSTEPTRPLDKVLYDRKVGSGSKSAEKGIVTRVVNPSSSEQISSLPPTPTRESMQAPTKRNQVSDSKKEPQAEDGSRNSPLDEIEELLR